MHSCIFFAGGQYELGRVNTGGRRLNGQIYGLGGVSWRVKWLERRFRGESQEKQHVSYLLNFPFGSALETFSYLFSASPAPWPISVVLRCYHIFNCFQRLNCFFYHHSRRDSITSQPKRNQITTTSFLQNAYTSSIMKSGTISYFYLFFRY
jgi:hypothetical protein